MCIDRQGAKEGLAGEIVDGDADARKFDSDELSSLFQPNFHTRSSSHDRMGCRCCSAGAPPPPADGALPPPDANGFSHVLPGSAALERADPVLASVASTSRVTIAYVRLTDKSTAETDTACRVCSE